MSSPLPYRGHEHTFWVVFNGPEPGASRVPKRVPPASEAAAGAEHVDTAATQAASEPSTLAAIMPRAFSTADAAPGYTGVRRIKPPPATEAVTTPPKAPAAASPPRSPPPPSIDKFTMVCPPEEGAQYRAIAYDADTGVRVALQCFDDTARDSTRRDVIVDDTVGGAHLRTMGRTLLFNEKFWIELYISHPEAASAEYAAFMKQALRALGVAQDYCHYVDCHKLKG